MTSVTLEPTSNMDTEDVESNSDNSEILDSDGNRLSSPVEIGDYQDALERLKEFDMTYNYTCQEIINLMERLTKQDITNNEIAVNDFVTKAIDTLSNYKWTYYGESNARLELLLRAISSLLRIVSRSIRMIDGESRTNLYKSVSKFWIIYRNTDCINANIMFALREIRNSLRKIKDDRPSTEAFTGVANNVVKVAFNVFTENYFAALGAFVGIFNFEYPAGEWYFDWIRKREKYMRLYQRYSNSDDKEVVEIERIKKFYGKLYKSSVREFEKVKRKNTNLRNFEYKFLKSGGMLAKYSLPDHIDSLLIGYLNLFQRLLEDFFTQIKDNIEEIVSFCYEIIQDNVKKQLTFKAVEVLHVVKDIDEVDKGIKDRINWNFLNYFNNLLPLTPPSPSTPSSIPSQYNFVASPTSYEFNNPPSPASSENKKRQKRRPSVRSIVTYVSDFQSVRHNRLLNTRERIVKDVIKLFKDRRAIKDNINGINGIKNKLKLNLDTVGSINNINLDDVLSKLDEILKSTEEKKASLPPIPQFPRIEVVVKEREVLPPVPQLAPIEIPGVSPTVNMEVESRVNSTHYPKEEEIDNINYQKKEEKLNENESYLEREIKVDLNVPEKEETSVNANDLAKEEINENVNVPEKEINENVNVSEKEINENVNVSEEEINENVNVSEKEEISEDANDLEKEISENANDLEKEISEDANDLEKEISEDANDLEKEISENANDLEKKISESVNNPEKEANESANVPEKEGEINENANCSENNFEVKDKDESGRQSDDAASIYTVNNVKNVTIVVNGPTEQPTEQPTGEQTGEDDDGFLRTFKKVVKYVEDVVTEVVTEGYKGYKAASIKSLRSNNPSLESINSVVEKEPISSADEKEKDRLFVNQYEGILSVNEKEHIDEKTIVNEINE